MLVWNWRTTPVRRQPREREKLKLFSLGDSSCCKGRLAKLADCLQLRVATVAESNFRVARKNVGENQASTLASESREPDIYCVSISPSAAGSRLFSQKFASDNK